MDDIISFSPLMTIPSLIYQGYSFFCLKHQFPSMTRDIKFFLYLIALGMMVLLVSFSGDSGETVLIGLGQTRNFQGALAGLVGLGFLSFFASALYGNGSAKQVQVLRKLPFFGLLLGYSLIQTPVPPSLLLILFFSFPALFLFKERSHCRMAFRSFMVFWGAMTIALFLGPYLGGLGVLGGSYFLIHSLNFFLVKDYFLSKVS